MVVNLNEMRHESEGCVLVMLRLRVLMSGINAITDHNVAGILLMCAKEAVWTVMTCRFRREAVCFHLSPSVPSPLSMSLPLCLGVSSLQPVSP